MQAKYQDLTLTDNTNAQRFEMHVWGLTAYLEYQPYRHMLMLVHTAVPAALQGQGVGSALVEKVLHHIAERHSAIIPMCGFVVSYIAKHPQWHRLIAPGYLPSTEP